MYHSCFCNLTVNESHLQKILVRVVYLQQVFLLPTIITCLWAKMLSLALTFCLKVHSNLGVQRFNILVFYIRKDWKRFILMESVFLFIYYVLFGCPSANFGPLPRAQPYSPNLHHSIYVKFQPKSHWELPNKIGFLNPAKRLVNFQPGTFWFTHNPLTLLAFTFTMHDTSIYSSYLTAIY